MTLPELAINIAVSLASGSVGGVLFASRISHQAEKGKRRFEAENAVRSLISTFRDVMAYRHADIAVHQRYPSDYLTEESQDQLVEDVLRWLPYLSRRRRHLLRGGLEALVGPLAVRMGEAIVLVPDSERNEDRRFAWRHRATEVLIEKQIETGFMRGQFGRVKADIHDQQAYDDALATLDGMRALVPANGGQRLLRGAIQRRRARKILRKAIADVRKHTRVEEWES